MKRALLILAGLAAGAGCGLAAERTTRELTLMDCQKAALQNNLQIRIERINPEIARLTLNASHGIYDPIFFAQTKRENLADSGGFDPADFSKDAVYEAESLTANVGLTGLTPSGMSYELSGDYANSFGQRNFMFFDSFNINAGITLSQPLLRDFWIDQGRMTIQVNRAQLKISESSLAYTVMDVLCQLQQAYYELMHAREYLALREELVATRGQFWRAVEKQVSGGILTAPDARLAQGQLAAAEADAAAARSALGLAENNLRLLLGESFTNHTTEALAPVERLTALALVFDYATSYQNGLRQRPDLAWLRAEVEKADINLKYRYNQLFPAFNVIAGMGRRGANTVQDFWSPPSTSSGPAFDQLRGAGAPNHMVGVVFSIPLSRTAERNNFRLGKQLREQAQLMVRQKEEMVLREVADALAAAEASLQRVAATRQAAEHAAAVLAAEEKRLAGGKTTVFFVLQYQSNLALARAAELRARADYNQACARLRFAEGAIIEASGLAWKVN